MGEIKARHKLCRKINITHRIRMRKLAFHSKTKQNPFLSITSDLFWRKAERFSERDYFILNGRGAFREQDKSRALVGKQLCAMLRHMCRDHVGEEWKKFSTCSLDEREDAPRIMTGNLFSFVKHTRKVRTRTPSKIERGETLQTCLRQLIKFVLGYWKGQG